MRKLSNVLPLIPAATGAAAFFLRRWELATVFDPVTGYATRGAAVTVVLAALCLLTAAACFVAGPLLTKKRVRLPGYDRSFRPDITGRAALYVASVTLTAAGTVYLAENLRSGIAPVVLGLFAALTGLSCIATTHSAARGTSGSELYLFGAVPPLFFGYWLIVTYRANITNSVLLDFIWISIALGVLTLSWYYDAGYIYNRQKPAATLAFGLMSVHFGILALADVEGLAPTVILAAAVLHRILTCRSLIANLGEREEPAG